MISKTLVALCAVTSSLVSATTDTGVHASLDIAVIEQAKTVYFDKILSYLNDLQIPDINSGSDYIHSNHVSVSQSAQNVVFQTDVANNALVLTCNDLSAVFKTDSFRSHWLFFIATGNIEVDMNSVSIGMGLSFGTQTLTSGAIVPKVTAVDVTVDINKSDIDLHIHGNIWTDFASAFEVFFKGTVVDLIRDEIRDTLTKTLPDFANDFVAKTDGDWEVKGAGVENWILDWQTPSPAVVTDTTFSVGALGIMYDGEPGFGESEWRPSNFTDMPSKVTSRPSQFQAFLSTASVNSLMGSWLEISDLAGTIKGDGELMQSLNHTITAKELKLVFGSGFTDKYGDDSIVDVAINATELKDFASSQANQEVSVKGTVNFKFYPRFNGTTELAVDFDVIDVEFIGGIMVENYTAMANITRFHADKVHVNYSSCGNISTFKLKLEINTGMAAAVAYLTSYLQKYNIKIPSDIFGIFKLSDLFIYYMDGYIYAGATPTFEAPAFNPAKARPFEIPASKGAMKELLNLYQI